jgi:apolipoprotein N-acyltransferase
MPRATDLPSKAVLGSWKLWLSAVVSAVLLELAFPLAGPMAPWRSLFAWFGLAPLLWALVAAGSRPRPLRLGFLLGYLAGVLWYMGNCYWVRDTMMKYGDMPPFAPELLLLGFGLYLGLYWGAFGLCFAAAQRRFSFRTALAAAPFLWIALDLAAARITSFPWDQLGYSQIDNGLLTRLAPWTGVYGITFVLVAANSLIAGRWRLNWDIWTDSSSRGRLLGRRTWLAAGLLVIPVLMNGIHVRTPTPAPTATAVLIQPNLRVEGVGFWAAPGEWEAHMATFARLANEQCKTYIAGIPETGASGGEIICPPYATHPDLVVWPESPAPYFEEDPRYRTALQQLTTSTQAPFIVGTVGMDLDPEAHDWREFNSALVTGQDGHRIGRYDKIHLVPFGEYVPFQRFLFFARKLTGKVSRFDRGQEHSTFLINGHRYGVFICYEAVFADEVREYAKYGAEALVNISDDGWYGDTSAPWQHLNMTRMRAIENRRWIVRATNNGITASIDPYGRVRQSIPRHAEDALPAGYGFRTDTTFYTAHGDVFAWLCVLLSLGLIGWSGRSLLEPTKVAD